MKVNLVINHKEIIIRSKNHKNQHQFGDLGSGRSLLRHQTTLFGFKILQAVMNTNIHINRYK
jgi:hypothetical protein